MKVAVFGQTLYSGVMAALLAECGHQVFWCDILKGRLQSKPIPKMML
jgi:UDPglucose 6-dehydrogenase